MIVAALLAMLIVQQLFWSVTCHRLVNKLMCRSYFEYQQAEQAFTPKPPVKVQEQDPDEDIDAMVGVGGF